MEELNIFKIEYYWYEGDHKETLLVKSTSRNRFEKDLLEAKQFVEKLRGTEIKEGEYLGKGYRIECLPEFYEQIIWFLMKKKGYKECQFNEDISYILDDGLNKKINVTKNEKTTRRNELKYSTKN